MSESGTAVPAAGTAETAGTAKIAGTAETGVAPDSAGAPARGRLGLTPAQTVGPFLSLGLPWDDGPYVVPDGTPGAVRIGGRVLDGAGEPVPDALVETWQADPAGHFDHPDDPRGPAGDSDDGIVGFRGFGRCPTDADGRWWVLTVKPGPLPCPDGRTEAPHLDISVFARGMLHRVVTRLYFPDESAANSADPVLATVPDGRRPTLVARGAAAGADDAAPPQQNLVFDIRLQGTDETVFFAL